MRRVLHDTLGGLGRLVKSYDSRRLDSGLGIGSVGHIDGLRVLCVTVWPWRLFKFMLGLGHGILGLLCVAAGPVLAT
jgi:hypothetical protein